MPLKPKSFVIPPYMHVYMYRSLQHSLVTRAVQSKTGELQVLLRLGVRSALWIGWYLGEDGT